MLQSASKKLDVGTLRKEVRAGRFTGQTAGQAPDLLQGNLVVLPLKYADDFLVYCMNNPKPCPLIGFAGPGDPYLRGLGEIDIRTDVPKYRIFRDGSLCEEVTEISGLWRDDLVTFVLGCSFTFEEALIRKSYTVRHVELGRNVPMFRTNIETVSGGIFSGPMVVSMRAFHQDQIPAIFDLSAGYAHAHGTPVYWGDPSAIGISDLSMPDYGDAVPIQAGEVPVFWACGVTPQAAIARAKPDFCITHAPGCMLVTDVPSTEPPEVLISLAALRNHIQI